MNINQMLMKFFNLPKPVMLFLALAGFGSLASVLWWVLPALKDPKAKIWILIILGIGLALFLVVAGIRWLVTRKKSSALTGALESQGPTRGDLAEQEQIYREKFRQKLADLRGASLHVYQLPWFVLMGEPGSGKTATLIHSGLDFPLGKDEVAGFGGTRNYNWWFTNQAVILDTAGRISFHEEGTTDKAEWEYFLKLLKQYRPRCPINGVIIALPADKLLRDSAEERGRKATILRERMRQVHQILGVRFPAFIIVTKMDLVGGFNEFFADLKSDLLGRNQMCGWSRPGAFQEPYDPGTFPATFDEVHRRIRDWGLKYLQRKATEEELGMIVTFPEAFRDLREPLTEYVSQVFQKSPLIEPPFFRGFYLTSSVQEGIPILDIFSKSQAWTGPVGRGPKQVESKAFFIHDFYDKKVFPEQGLVFRSAKHVTLNKRMRRMVWYGTSAMALLMAGAFTVGALNVSSLVTSPQKAAESAAAKVFAARSDPTKRATFREFKENVGVAESLAVHLNKYGGFGNYLMFRLMFIGANPRVPEAHVRTIHSQFVLDTLVRPTLEEFVARVREGKLPVASSTPAQRRPYIEAAAQYAEWFGEGLGVDQQKGMTSENAAARAKGFEKLLVALGADNKDAVVTQIRLAFESLADGRRVFTRDVLMPVFPALAEAREGVVTKVLDEIQRYYEPRTRLTDEYSTNDVKYWIGLFERLNAAGKKYAALLDLAKTFADGKTFSDAAKPFLDATQTIDDLGSDNPPQDGTFAHAWHQVAVYLKTPTAGVTLPQKDNVVLRLRDLKGQLQASWDAEIDPIATGLAQAAKAELPGVMEGRGGDVWRAITAAKKSLSDKFDASLTKLMEELGAEGAEDPLDYYVKQKVLVVSDARGTVGEFKGPPRIEIAPSAFGDELFIRNILHELRELVSGASASEQQLADVAQWPSLITQMKQTNASALGSQKHISNWSKAIPTEKSGGALQAEIAAKSGVAQQAYWQPVKLYALVDAVVKGRQSVMSGATIDRMIKICEWTVGEYAEPERGLPPVKDRFGLGRLRPGEFDAPAKDLPFERHRFNQIAAAAPTEEKDDARETTRRRTAPAPPKDSGDDRGEGRTGRRQADSVLTTYHTRDFLARTLWYHQLIRRAVGDAGNLPHRDEFLAAVDKSAAKYIATYMADWYRVYSTPTERLGEGILDLMERCQQGKLDWAGFQAELTKRGDEFSSDLAARQTALLTHALFMYDGINTVVLAQPPNQKTATDEIAAAVERFIDAHRDDVGRAQDLTTIFGRVEQKQKSLRNVAIESQLATQMMEAWSRYVKQVRELGPLDGKTPPALNATPPDLGKLTSDVVLAGANDVDTTSVFVTPLLDVAAYGRDLLAHRLEAEIRTIYKDWDGSKDFPYVRPDVVHDDSHKLEKLSRTPLPDSARFFKLLEHVREFEGRWGKWYRDTAYVPRPQSTETLDRTLAWATFLYGDAKFDPSGPSDGIDVSFEFDPANRPAGTTEFFSIYQRVVATLPLLGPSGVAPPVVLDYGAKAEAGTGLKWLITRTDFPKTKAEASVLSQAARKDLWPETAVAWELAGNPWVLPMLLSTSDRMPDGEWRIPVIVDPIKNDGTAASEPRGTFIKVKFSPKDAKRVFPGLIPPLSNLPDLPKMVKAGDYLKPKVP